jgi:heptosyltransferase-2
VIRHLLVRAPNWVGDVVMATPVFAAAVLDSRFERVTVAVREHLAPVLHDGPCAERLLPLARGGDEAAALRATGADAALLLTSSFGAAWRAFRAGIPVRAGAALGPRRLLLTHRVVPPTEGGRRAPIPTAHLLRDAAGLLGIAPRGLHPSLGFRAEVGARAGALLGEAGLAEGAPYALCSPGAAFGASKLWPPERYAAVLDHLHDTHGLVGVVSGGPGEERLVETVARTCRHPALSLAGRGDLEVLKPIVAGARILLVGDSGPRWYAAAFDVPCVTVMGPNSPALTASSLERCEVVRLAGLPCSPCLRRRCPLGHHRCMVELPATAVAAAAERLLAGNGTEAA